MEKRKSEYFQNKDFKEKLFREIEHEKTKLRIIESKTEKNSTSKNTYPFKISIGIRNIKINSKKILNNLDPDSHNFEDPSHHHS